MNKAAKNLNTLIIRTIDLLYLIRTYENQENPGVKLLELSSKGGGLLKVEDSNVKIIN